MRTGVSTASLFMRENNEDALPLLDALGVKTAEVFLTSFCEYDEQFGELLAKRRGQVCVHSMHILNTQFEPQLFNQNPRTRDDAFLWLRKALSAGRAMGATHYTFHGISRVKRESRSGKYDPKAVWGRALEEVRSTCAEYGITLCLETVEWASYNHPGVFRDMREYCPDLHGVLDVKQARISGYPYGMYIKEMAGALAHVHVSDVDDKGKICLPGKGIFNFPELLKRLNDAGFDGPLLIEVYKNDYADPKELKTSCDYLDELIYKYGF